MNSSFDPYHKWLGIPPEEQPPNHYRLLGVRLFEPDPEVIDISADRQLTHIRSFANGPHSELSQRLLNEISAARLCLLMPEQKAAYDAQLERARASREPHPPEPPPAAAPLETFGTVASHPLLAASYHDVAEGMSGAISRVISYRTLLVISASALAVACLAVAIVWVVLGVHPAPDDKRLDTTAQLSSSDLAPPQPPMPRTSSTDGGAGGGAAHEQAQPPLPADDESTLPATVEETSDVSEAETTADSTVTRSPTAGTSGKSNVRNRGRNRSPRVPGRVKPRAGKSTLPATGAGSPSSKPDGPPQQAPNPFDGLPDEVDLGLDGWTGPLSRHPLGRLLAPIDATCRVNIDSGAADFGGMKLEMGGPTTDGDVTRWPIHVTATGMTDAPAPEARMPGLDTTVPLAYVVAEHDSLAFLMNDQQSGGPLRQLRNCILSMSDGSHAHQLQLRTSKRENAIRFDSDNSNITRDISLEDPPLDDRLSLQVSVVGSRSADVTMKPHSGESELNEDVSLTLTQWPGAEIAVRLYRSGGQYRVKVVGRYELNGRNYPLSTADIAKDIARMQNQVGENRKDVRDAQTRLRQIPIELDRLGSLKPRNPRESVLLHTAADQLAKEGQKLESRIRRLTDATPQLEENLAALEKLPPLISRISGQLTIRIRVFAQTDNGRLELYTAL